MNRRLVILIIVISCLFIMTVIAVVILTGKTEIKSFTAPAQFKRPVIEKSIEEERPAAGNAENVSAGSEKEFEPPVKGALLN